MELLLVIDDGLLGRADRVLEQECGGHGPDAAGHRRQSTDEIPDLSRDVARAPTVFGGIRADVDDDRPRGDRPA